MLALTRRTGVATGGVPMKRESRCNAVLIAFNVLAVRSSRTSAGGTAGQAKWLPSWPTGSKLA